MEAFKRNGGNRSNQKMKQSLGKCCSFGEEEGWVLEVLHRFEASE